MTLETTCAQSRSQLEPGKTITPNFNVVTNDLQSYNKEWQYLEAVVKSADIISLEQAKQLISATQNEVIQIVHYLVLRKQYFLNLIN